MGVDSTVALEGFRMDWSWDWHLLVLRRGLTEEAWGGGGERAEKTADEPRIANK